MTQTLQVAVILPAYNEEQTVGETVKEFHAALPDAEIIVVDNRSSDHTFAAAEAAIRAANAKGRVLRELRPGKANALRKAFREVDADVYVMADADLTYSAADLPSLLVPVLKGDADVVVGNRHANSVYRSQNDRPFHDFGNGFVRWLINFLFRSNLQDIMSGYRVLSYRFVKSFPVLSEGFEVETEMTLHAVQHRFSITELPIAYRKRPEGSFSKLNTTRDGIRVLRTVLWIFKDYRPLPFFLLLSATSFGLGAVIGIPVIAEFMRSGLVPRFPSAILAMGLMVFSALFFATAFIVDPVVKNHRANFELFLIRNFSGRFRADRR